MYWIFCVLVVDVDRVVFDLKLYVVGCKKKDMFRIYIIFWILIL